MSVKPPERLFSFSDHHRANPNAPPPGDRLDAQFLEHASAITDIAQAVARVVRDDGRLRNGIVGPEQLQPELIRKVTAEIDAVATPLMTQLRLASAALNGLAADARMNADDAERAAVATAQIATAAKGLLAKMEAIALSSTADEATVKSAVEDAQNWAMYSQIQAENSYAHEQQSLKWAEYLAGPVIDNINAPDFIESSKFPHGLFYQPVEGAGGTGGLWSAKWWALYAQNLVGAWNFYYLGAWDHSPLPGEINPATGAPVPNPLAEGSLYYNTVTNELMVWNGTGWAPPYVLTGAAASSFTYICDGVQTTFTGPDAAGSTPVVGTYQSDAFLNGVRLAQSGGSLVGDFAVNDATNTLTLAAGIVPAAGSILQWDLLVEPNAGGGTGGTVLIEKLDPITPNGTLQDFTLTFDGGATAAIGETTELQVTVDGIVQEPGVDFTATGDDLHFLTAPAATAKIWMLWFRPGI